MIIAAPPSLTDAHINNVRGSAIIPEVGIRLAEWHSALRSAITVVLVSGINSDPGQRK
jgi:hypothetical protein